MRSIILTLVLLIALLIIPAAVAAAPPAMPVAPPVADSLGPIVDTIIIDNRNVFDTDKPKYDNYLFKLANRIHYTTDKDVIRRELLFEQGEPYPWELAEETGRNIRNRLPVFDAWLTVDTLPNGHLQVTVVTIDEWTLSLGPSISREGNESRFDLTATERNLFGRGQEVRTEWVLQEADDNYFGLSYFNRRIRGYDYSVDMGLNTDPQQGLRWFRVSRPFYSLSQDYAYSVGLNDSDGRRDIYSNDRRIARSYYEGNLLNLFGAMRTGTYRRKLQLNLQYIYRYESNFDKVIEADASAADSALARSSFPTDTTYHLTRLGLQIANLDFAKMTRIDGFDYTEDFALGQGIGLSYGRAFKPDFNNHVYDVAELNVVQGYKVGSNLLYLDYQHLFWFRGSADIRRNAAVSIYFYSRRTDFLTVALHSAYVADWRDEEADGLVLGGSSGLRGYDKFFLTGDRRLTASAEARFFPGLTIHSAVVSPVLFGDFGQMWKSGDPARLDHSYGAVGAGLRIGLEHSSRARIIRIDVAYSEFNGWQLSIGTDHYFRAADVAFRLTSP